MSDQESAPPPMDADLRALLRGTKSSFDVEANRHMERAFARLAQTLPDLGPSSPSHAPSLPEAVESTATKLRFAKLAAPLIGSALAGAVVTYVAMPVRERVVYVERQVIVPASPSPSPAMSPRAIHVDDLPSTAKTQATASATVSSGGDVSVERLLLDEARVAFAAGDYAKSLERVERHKGRFPSGVLSEEREALAVRALAGGGKKAEAAKRARAFVTKYPDSIMRPAVEAAADEP